MQDSELLLFHRHWGPWASQLFLCMLSSSLPSQPLLLLQVCKDKIVILRTWVATSIPSLSYYFFLSGSLPFQPVHQAHFSTNEPESVFLSLWPLRFSPGLEPLCCALEAASFLSPLIP